MSVPMSAPPASLQVDEVDAFMSGMVIHYLVGDDGSRTQVVEVAKNVARHGGVATSSYDARRVTHVVLEETTLGKSEELYARATKDKKRVVSWDWIEACLKQGALVPVDDSALYRPPPSVDGLPAMKDLKVCVTGYTGDRRTQLIKITERLGAEYMRVLDRKSTHLVCYEFEGAKWAKANQTGIQRVVSHAWLEDCLKKWTRLPEEPYTHRSGKE
jgi:topoisomerase (DNA) II binding protein 1